jgi:hypothetical protein
MGCGSIVPKATLMSNPTMPLVSIRVHPSQIFIRAHPCPALGLPFLVLIEEVPEEIERAFVGTEIAAHGAHLLVFG